MCTEGMDKQYPIRLICEELGIDRSTFYRRKRKRETTKEQEINKLRRIVRRIFEENNREYGRCTMQKALEKEGYKMSVWKAAKLMRLERLRPRKCKKYKATTNSKHKYQVAENKLNREFNPPKPNMVWCGDSTYIQTDEGWLYVSGMIDLCDRSCVGLCFSARHTQELMLETLKSAYKEHRPGKGLMFHSDRGVQYACNAFKEELKKKKAIQSMSKSGVPYDNAPMESFWATVKTGCVNGRRFRTRKEAEKVIFEYVFGFYNTHRYHAAIGYEIPTERRKRLLQSA